MATNEFEDEVEHGKQIANLQAALQAKDAEIAELRSRIKISDSAVRTGINFRLAREEKSIDWKEHLERFDFCIKQWRDAAHRKPEEAGK